MNQSSFFARSSRTSSRSRASSRRRLVVASVAGVLTLTLTVDPFALGSMAPVLADEISPFNLQSRGDAFDDVVASLGQDQVHPSVPLTADLPGPSTPGTLNELLAVPPAEDEEIVALPGSSTPPGDGPVEVDLGGVEVTVDTVDVQTAPEAVLVRVAGEQETVAAGITGVLLDVSDASSTPAPTQPEVELTVSYESFAGLGGADWASRLGFVWVPDCAVPGTDCIAQPIETINDSEAQTVTAVVPVTQSDVEPTSLASTMTTASGGAGGTLGITAGAAGAQGNWGATSLSPSATWGNSGNTGSFTWSLGMNVPSPAVGPSPELALSYSSAASDGRLPTTNNQSGPIGEGFDLTSGYIERTYTPCMDDESSTSNNENRPSGDLCWGVENATMVFNGSASELIRSGTSNIWHSKFADGSRIERLVGSSNGGQKDEYWKVTTTDGVQYFFGRGQRAGDSMALNSAWTVPVYGNNSGEPCYKSESNGGFEDSRCNQVWRWNLEYVIDPVGNSMTYFYAKEDNRYIYDYQGNFDGDTVAYTAGGRLDRIEYGTRAGQEASSTAPATVSFHYGPRCITDLDEPDSFCSTGQSSVNDNHWLDTPVDLVCSTANEDECGVTPAFFSRYRLAKVVTSAQDGTAYQPITTWTLGQTYRPQGDGGLPEAQDPMLVLGSVTETGHGGTTSTADDITKPSIDFSYVFLRNRVEVPNDNHPPLPRPRVASIRTESGATVSVNYRTECGPDNGGVPGTSEADQESNDTLAIRSSGSRMAAPPPRSTTSTSTSSTLSSSRALPLLKGLKSFSLGRRRS